MLESKTIRKSLFLDERGQRLNWSLYEVYFIKAYRILWKGAHQGNCSIDLNEPLLKRTKLLSDSAEVYTAWTAETAFEDIKLIGSGEIILNLPPEIMSVRASIELDCEVRNTPPNSNN